MDETPAHLIRMRADLMHAVRTDARAAKRRRGRGRLGAIAVAAVTAVTLFAVGLPTGGGGGGVTPKVDESLAGVLHTAAINAAGQAALPIPSAGHYYHFTDTELGYVALRGARTEEACFTSCPPLPGYWDIKAWVHTSVWIGADGSAFRTTSFGKPVFRNTQVRADLAAGKYAGSTLSHPMGRSQATFFPPHTTSEWSFGGMTLKQVYALPSDPHSSSRSCAAGRRERASLSIGRCSSWWATSCATRPSSPR